MSLVVAYSDIKPEQVTRTAHGSSTAFFRARRQAVDAPSAFISQHDAGSHGGAHFHEIDQFQIIVDGKGRFGRHDVCPYYVHFSRAYTPYGPLEAGQESGFSFMVLRSRFDKGAQYFPDSLDKLKKVPDRRPWQITRKVEFPRCVAGVRVQEVAEIRDEQGLFARALTMAPLTHMVAPDPSQGDGQFVVVLKGSLRHDGRELTAPTVAYIKPDEPAFPIHAGAEGLEGLILNLPQVKPRSIDTRTASVEAGFNKWQCTLCSFSYDEALGMQAEGIAAGTRWKDIPESWSCPDCSAGKSEFQKVEE
jgi:rubredoxin